MDKLYVQYGCGHSAPKEWTNFDVSPTLRIQKLPIIGSLLKGSLNTTFPSNVKYGNIITGLPVADNSCDGVYCSHTLEHLSLQDLKTALKNTYTITKPGGIFRCVLPDLEWSAREYIGSLEKDNPENASIEFMNETLLGVNERKTGFKAMVSSAYGNSKHLWMWDYQSLSKVLKEAGFSKIRRCNFNDSSDKMFEFVEEEGRFTNALAIECIK